MCKAPSIDSRTFRTAHQLHFMASGHVQSTSDILQNHQDSTTNTLNGFWTSVKQLGYNPESSGLYTKYTQWLLDICKAHPIDSRIFRTAYQIYSMASRYLQSTSNRLWKLQDICKAHPIDFKPSGHTPNTLNCLWTSAKHLGQTSNL